MLNLTPDRADDEGVIPATPRLRDERGYTLIEVMVAAMILVTGVLGILTLLNTANGATHRTKVRDGATSLAREMIEAARAVPYPDLQATTVVGHLQAQPGLDDTTGDATWHIVRRNIEYTATASLCSVDAGKDGYGDHGGSTFCSDSTTVGTGDTNPDDYKRVAVDVSYTARGKTVNVRQEAVINDPGSAFAPSVIAMKASATTVTSPTVNAIVFNPVTTSMKADSVRWYVDNVQKGTAAGSNKTWQYTWNLDGVSDGTYQVRAQAYDRYGQTGAGYVVTIVLNRFAPAAPGNVVGGRNPLWGDLVELEWAPNPERDVSGYEVYRVKGGAPSTANDTLVCSRVVSDADATSCLDPAAPAGNQQYYVVALGPPRPPATGVDRSDMSLPLIQTDGNVPPVAPASVTATSLPGGGVQLTWPAASDTDGTIRYYRIYRDGTASTAARLDRTDAGTTLEWTDESPTASSRRYWVTTVDNQMAESPFAPPDGVMP
jgi:type II secretory pathway pseudopilin PulG